MKCLRSYVFRCLKSTPGKRGAVDEEVASAGKGPMKEVGKSIQELGRGEGA